MSVLATAVIAAAAFIAGGMLVMSKPIFWRVWKRRLRRAFLNLPPPPSSSVDVAGLAAAIACEVGRSEWDFPLPPPIPDRDERDRLRSYVAFKDNT